MLSLEANHYQRQCELHTGTPRQKVSLVRRIGRLARIESRG
jgi:hypothetical protein